MADKKVKLADLVKGSGFVEIPKKWIDTNPAPAVKGGNHPIDLVLPAKKEVVLQAAAEESRGLIIKWTDGEGYEIQYWYDTPDNIVPSELIADGKSKGKAVKKAILKYHAKPVDESIKLKRLIENTPIPKFKSPLEAYKWIMDKRGEAMDIEQEMMDTNAEIQQLYSEMEQEAEPTGGPISDRYGTDIEALEDRHKDLRAELDMLMAAIEEYDMSGKFSYGI